MSVLASQTSAAFLDRDGTLIEDTGYPRDPGQVRLLPGAAPALRRLRALGLRLVVVSNQSGLGRGLITSEEAEAVHARFVQLLGLEGVRLDDVRYCPHAPDAGCDCRKPAPRLLLEAARDLGIDLEASFMIGDQTRDLESGRRAGCGHIILLGTAEPGSIGDDARIAKDWSEVEAIVLAALTA